MELTRRLLRRDRQSYRARVHRSTVFAERSYHALHMVRYTPGPLDDTDQPAHGNRNLRPACGTVGPHGLIVSSPLFAERRGSRVATCIACETLTWSHEGPVAEPAGLGASRNYSPPKSNIWIVSSRTRSTVAGDGDTVAGDTPSALRMASNSWPLVMNARR
jgi:hypothetical protein